MNHCGKFILAVSTACIIVLICTSIAQDNSKLPYMNPKLSPEERSADLVHRMTLEEKASQLVNQARAIPSLNVPAYDWWSEALHGVSVNGTTEFPEPIGLAATFDVRSEEHTSELQSRFDLVCRLLLEKKKKQYRCIISCVMTCV